MKRICVTLKDFDHIVAVLKRVNRDAYFNSVEGCYMDQRSIVALNERLIVAHDSIKEAYGTQRDAGKNVRASDDGARMQIIVDEEICRVKKDLEKADNQTRAHAIESGRRGRENMVMDGLVDTLHRLFKNADDPNWSVQDCVTELQEWRRNHDGANQLER